MTGVLVQKVYDKLSDEQMYELRDYYAARAVYALAKFVEMGYNTNHEYFKIEKSGEDVTVIVYSSVKIWGAELTILMELLKDETFKMAWVEHDSNMQMVAIAFTSTVKRMLEREISLGKGSRFSFIREVVKA